MHMHITCTCHMHMHMHMHMPHAHAHAHAHPYEAIHLLEEALEQVELGRGALPVGRGAQHLHGLAHRRVLAAGQLLVDLRPDALDEAHRARALAFDGGGHVVR